MKQQMTIYYIIVTKTRIHSEKKTTTTTLRKKERKTKTRDFLLWNRAYRVKHTTSENEKEKIK